MVISQQFRKDLWFRLNVFPIRIPPLRERKEDIPLLVRCFIEKKSKELKLHAPPKLAPGTIDTLLDYHWPGNVRELENTIERALILDSKGPLRFDPLIFLHLEDETSSPSHQDDGSLKLDEVVSRHIQRVLRIAKGKINGPGGAAEMMDIHPNTLRNRMKKFGIPYGRGK